MEKRHYSRLSVNIYGTLYKDRIEIPVVICNISEYGIGIRYKFSDCPIDFKIEKGEEFSVTFFDDVDFNNENVQLCTFKVVQVRVHSTHSYIGAKLLESEYDYPQYVLDKKSEKFIGAVKFMDFVFT